MRIPRRLRVRWGWLTATTVLLLGTNTIFGAATFAVITALWIVWLGWRGDRDSAWN